MDAKALSLRLETVPEDTGAPPEDLGDVLDPPGGDAREVHLDDGPLDRGLAPAVSLDDGRLEGRHGDTSCMLAYLLAVLRLAWSLRAISCLDAPSASIDCMPRLRPGGTLDWRKSVGVDTNPARYRRFQWIALLAG